MKIKLLILFAFICKSILSQNIQQSVNFSIDDIFPKQGNVKSASTLKSAGSALDFYNNLNNWIPYCNSEPLKNPPITYIELSFHVFLDDNGQNNDYTNTVDGKNRLLYLLNLVNSIYSGNWGPSDPVAGVVELPNRDTRIRFTLGDNNERIYFYNNTALNHEYNSGTFDTYIQNNFPSRSKLNIYFTAGFYSGNVSASNIVITNHGSGYTSAPTVTFNPAGAAGTAVLYYDGVSSINITNGGSYYGFSPPQITITGGGGSGATAIVSKLSGGATGYANMPSTNLSTTHHVVMCNSNGVSDWIFGFSLAHELGHDLDLLHTYCGGGASPVCCSGSCNQGCTQDCGNTEYLSDIFGPCPGTCPHNTGWYDPTSADPKHTNNVMGGSDAPLYFSPMQAGQMHRAIAIKSTRQYVKKETYSTIPLVISSSETWDFDLKLYRDLIISSGAVLTISSSFTLPYNGTITINSGAGLVIEGSLNLSDNNKIIVKSGGTLKLSSSANVQVNGNGKIEVQSGAYFCIVSGAVINLSSFKSVINLRNGYIVGVNTSIVPSSSCVSSPNTYSISGSGSINLFNQDIYIQNETISSSRYYAGRYIYVGHNVTSSKAQGDVLINNNSEVIFDADQDVLLDKGFEVTLGSSFEVLKK